MKNIYAICLMYLISFGCSKDFLKSYDKRIIGTWRIAEVNRVGFGGDLDELAFRSGNFTFNSDGTLTYVNNAGTLFQGSWEITKKHIGEETLRSLHITAIDFNAQVVLSEYYDNIHFWSTDHITAKVIPGGLHHYVTHLRR